MLLIKFKVLTSTMEQQYSPKFWYLEKFDFTQKLCKEEKIHLEKAMIMKNVNKDTFLHFPEMKEDYIYFLKEGFVKIVHINESGEEQIKYVLTPGNIFGELSLLDNREDPNDYAVAIDNCVICFMKVTELKAMMEKNNDLAIRINKLVGLRIKRIERKLENLIFKDAKTRIIEFLIELAQEFGKQEGNIVSLRSFLSHEEIAKITTTSRQTVTTVLNELKVKGLISYNKTKYEFHSLKLSN
jgi:CRP/FNR family cyclic AMP-dependent transcriptional regulator